MKCVRNENGIALVTALLFTMISLAMIMALLYYVLQGTKMSAAQKRYRNSLEASYGGAELVTKAIIPKLFDNYSTGLLSLRSDYGGSINLKINDPLYGMSTSDVLKTKLTKATADWGGTPLASRKSVNPKVMPDFIFTLNGTTPGNSYNVYSKIIDTVPPVGLIDTSGIDYLDSGVGVAGTSNSTQTPRSPGLYTVEVQGEASVNPKEKASLSVLYAY
jgi:hypothetical protein